MKQYAHLPVFGIGPFLGMGVVGSAAAGIILVWIGVIPKNGAVRGLPLSVLFFFLAAAFIISGALLWAPSMLGKKSVDKYIKKDALCTTGVYGIVRNPCYVGLTFIVIGVLFAARNLWLLLLPPLYYIATTVVLKCTEEKWLLSRYGEEYRAYMKRVNRLIPRFPKA